MLTCDAVLRTAADRQATDIHLLAGMPPLYRVHGQLQRLSEPVSADELELIVTQLLPEDRQGVAATDFSTTIPGIGRLRINLYRQRGERALAIRRIPPHPLTLEELGLPQTLVGLCAKRRGLVLVTGPTGSGKSTTLAALIDHINRMEPVHIVTLEDPVEFLHEPKAGVVTQREVGVDTPSFAAGLRGALRQDPDVLMVGEMRDLETMAQVLQAAETGHLVLATLHSSDAVSTIDRLIGAFPGEQQQQVRVQLAASLSGVISQRLFPRADKQGRIAALEILVATPAVRNLITTGKTAQLASVMQSGRSEGMRLMSDSVQDLSNRGLISYSDYQTWTQSAR